MARTLAAFLALMPLVASAADAQRISYLEQEVRNLQRQVMALSRQLDEMRTRLDRPTAQTPAATGAAVADVGPVDRCHALASGSVRHERTGSLAALSSAIAVLAAILAAIGVYSTVASAVARRQRDRHPHGTGCRAWSSGPDGGRRSLRDCRSRARHRDSGGVRCSTRRPRTPFRRPLRAVAYGPADPPVRHSPFS